MNPFKAVVFWSIVAFWIIGVATWLFMDPIAAIAGIVGSVAILSILQWTREP